MNKTLKKWMGYRFSSGGVTGEDYNQFQREMRADLKKQAKAVGLEVIAFRKNHYEFSAVLKNPLTGKYVYVSISDVRFWQDEWTYHTLYRRMKHEKDWAGEGNHFGAWEQIGTLAAELAASTTQPPHDRT